jgi:hypothetical protein
VYKSVESKITADVNILYNTVDIRKVIFNSATKQLNAFASNYAFLDKALPPYDAERLEILFLPSGKCIHLKNRFIHDWICCSTFPLTCSLFNVPLIECANECYLATLECSENWDEVPWWRIIKYKEYCFDILFLIKSMTNQLDAIKMENPYPIYPTNPFTQEPFTIQFLHEFAMRLYSNSVYVAPGLGAFMKKTPPSTTTSYELIEFFEENGLRYVKDMNGNELIGYWQNEYTPFTIYEYLKINNYIDNVNVETYFGSTILPDDYYFRYF